MDLHKYINNLVLFELFLTENYTDYTNFKNENNWQKFDK